MSTIGLEYGGDFMLNQYGGLQVVTGWDEVRQRLERAVLTNPATNNSGQGPLPPDYLYHPSYGAGAQRQIGQGIDADNLATVTAKVQQAVAADPSVDGSVAPTATLTQSGFQALTLAVNVTLTNQTQGQVVFAIT